MGFFSELDIKIQDSIRNGADFYKLKKQFPMLTDEQIDRYLSEDHDGGYDKEEHDGQPTEYQEWQDYMGGDDWDHGQYE